MVVTQSKPEAAVSGEQAKAQLAAELHYQRELLSYPSAQWAHRFTPEDVLDVLIIGAGQSAITVAGKLQHEGVTNVVMVDQAEVGKEGPWNTFARMKSLRSAKNLHGPDLGFPSATFEHWFQQQWGKEAWDALEHPPHKVWAEYLAWVRQELGLKLLSETHVVDVAAGPYGVAVTVADSSQKIRVLQARKLVIATGLLGGGGPVIPDYLAGVPSKYWAHSSEVFPHENLSGARVLVIGGGTSAYDNAAVALEQGATRVLQVQRRRGIPTVNSLRSMEFRGIFRHFDALPDEQKVEFTRRTLSLPMPPPDHAIQRCAVHEKFELRQGITIESVVPRGDEIVATFSDGEEEAFDFIITATGFEVNLHRISWLRNVVDDIALWRDRYPLTDSVVDQQLGIYPYLGEGMQCLPKDGNPHSVVNHIYLYNYAALASTGPSCHGINPLPFGSDNVVREVSKALFISQGHLHLRDHLGEDTSGESLAPITKVPA